MKVANVRAVLAIPFGIFFAYFGYLALQDYQSDRNALATALATPPEPVTLEELGRVMFVSGYNAAATNALDEFAVYNFANFWIMEIDDKPVFVVQADSRRGHFVVFFSGENLAFWREHPDFARLDEVASAIEADWGAHILRGRAVEGNINRGQIGDLLRAQGVDVDASSFTFAKMLYGDRDAALSRSVHRAGYTAVTLLVMGLIAIGHGFFVLFRRKTPGEIAEADWVNMGVRPK